MFLPEWVFLLWCVAPVVTFLLGFWLGHLVEPRITRVYIDGPNRLVWDHIKQRELAREARAQHDADKSTHTRGPTGTIRLQTQRPKE